MKTALRNMGALVLQIAPLAVLGCVDDDAQRAFDPDDLCAQMGGDRIHYDPIWSFEPGERSRMEGELLFSDDGSLSGRRPAWNVPGDGVVGYWALGDAEDPESDPLAHCASHFGGTNTQALNFWGPVSGTRQELGGAVYDLPNEGFTFSGGTVTLASASYAGTVTPPNPALPYWNRGGVIDASEFDGVSFWARLALPEEAITLDQALDLPAHPREPAIPQFGESQLGVLVQTVHTGLIEAQTAGGLADPEDESVEPIVLSEPCVDYNPWVPHCHRLLKEGRTLPSQCLSGGTPNPAGTTQGPTPIAYCRQELSSPEPLHPDCLMFIPKSACARPEFQDSQFDLLCGGVTDDDPPSETPIENWNELESGFRDQCWDGFRTVMEIDHRWRHYFLPFRDMRQLGWGRVAERFETDKIRSVGFMTSAWQPANVLVDEVAFYKKR